MLGEGQMPEIARSPPALHLARCCKEQFQASSWLFQGWEMGNSTPRVICFLTGDGWSVLLKTR